MIISLEMGVEFINQFGDISEEMVEYMAETYDKIISYINEKDSHNQSQCLSRYKI
ncbi:hypothetical protein [Desulforamulus reducens]|uniref:hypothetical protein n=1 Tax=Desulforamulus reducens TaxID=59610 RepID=UPI0012EA6E03|nr:hypothetical protein [Desulforamulus reducens]